jgi:hypothetical protein
MIDVYPHIRHLLTFESEDDFYYLQLLQRKKENPQLGSNSRVIRNYYIISLEHLDKRYDEIKKLCQVFNARAMLRLNKRSFEKVAFKGIQNVANSMANKEFKFVNKSYDRACGEGHNDKNKKWILDLDGDWSYTDVMNLIYYVNSCEPVTTESKLYVNLPTKNGRHLITKPFNLEAFASVYPTIEVHKDNPINLYIP